MLKELIDQFYLNNQKNKDQTRFTLQMRENALALFFLSLKMLRTSQLTQE
jgi:hypothetical protein